MIKSIKVILPTIFSFIGTIFAAISKSFFLISFYLHKLFDTDMGKKLVKYEAALKQMKTDYKLTRSKNSGAIVSSSDASTKLADIIAKKK